VMFLFPSTPPNSV